MARFVDEIMNRELFSLGPNDPAARALEHLLSLGITSAPVLDRQRRPIGVASLRDLIPARAGATVHDRLTAPPIALGPRDSIEGAARRLAEGNLHHAPVVDANGQVVGFVSVIDLLRGLLDLPQRHPKSFPHYDADLGVTWSDELPLDGDHANSSPKRGGLLALVHGGAGVSNTVLHVEECDDLRARIGELVASRCATLPAVAWLMEGGRLWFRWAALDDPGARSAAHRRARERREEAERHARLGI